MKLFRQLSTWCFFLMVIIDVQGQNSDNQVNVNQASESGEEIDLTTTISPNSVDGNKNHDTSSNEGDTLLSQQDTSITSFSPTGFTNIVETILSGFGFTSFADMIRPDFLSNVNQRQVGLNELLGNYIQKFNPFSKFLAVKQVLFFHLFYFSIISLFNALHYGALNLLNLKRTPLLVYKEVEDYKPMEPHPAPAYPPPHKVHGYEDGMPKEEKAVYRPYHGGPSGHEGKEAPKPSEGHGGPEQHGAPQSQGGPEQHGPQPQHGGSEQHGPPPQHGGSEQHGPPQPVFPPQHEALPQPNPDNDLSSYVSYNQNS